MLPIIQFLHSISEGSVRFAEQLSKLALLSGKEIAGGSLHLTGNLLHFLSLFFFFVEDWEKGLQIARDNVRYSKDVVENAMDSSMEHVEFAFSISSESLEIARKFAIDFIYDNKAISSILGSSHHNSYSLSHIKMSFRKKGVDISVGEAIESIIKENGKTPILYIPGLFCDETVWLDKEEIVEEKKQVSLGLADSLLRRSYPPLFIRFNHGLHTSQNGDYLLELLDEYFSQSNEPNLHIIAYSQGGLIIRSTLYRAMQLEKPWLNKIKKVLLISSPDGGSYLEKIGFWFGFLMEVSPDTAFKLIGMIGNMRSDGIKDLSHGVIRKEDWESSAQIRRYAMSHYYGELDNIDAYQIYSFFGGEWAV